MSSTPKVVILLFNQWVCLWYLYYSVFCMCSSNGIPDYYSTSRWCILCKGLEGGWRTWTDTVSGNVLHSVVYLFICINAVFSDYNSHRSLQMLA